jgi:hypothetical protein
MKSCLSNRWADRITTDHSGCWLWAGALRSGYARADLNGRKVSVHRAMWEEANGPIPQGLELDHLCRVRACVNPGHLEPVTRLENVRRGDAGKMQRDRTHCPQGHPLSGDNLYVYVRTGKRECRECNRTRSRERQRRKAAA